MSSVLNLPGPPVTLVGRPMTVGEAVTIIPIVCFCAPHNPPLLIKNPHQPIACPSCGNVYAISRVIYELDPARGSFDHQKPLEIQVSLVGRSLKEFSQNTV